ncbi:polyphosphate kinase 1 [Reichenbachiella sp. MALMAid0571]|uniref:polyphosphate kinase 1 n=1 Tax=Reichenbachiella sp. MALMAid0571 TaxID=3143939 RepID=UPI0032DEB275
MSELHITEDLSEKFPFQDRDVSWLAFNRRVLMEAKDKSNPIFERLRFLAIYSSNQDEFFRVRVADIRQLVEINKRKINAAIDVEPERVLKEVHSIIRTQMDEYGDTLRNGVLKDLEKEGVFICDYRDLNEKQKAECLFYFKTKVLAFIQPFFFSTANRERFLNNRELYYVLRLKDVFSGRIEYAYLNIPSDKLSRFFEVPARKGRHIFVYLDDIVQMHLDFIFPDFEILECRAVKLNKDADLHIEDEYSGDLVSKIQKQISKRNLGTPSRFLYDSAISTELLEFITEAFNLSPDDMVPGGSHHNLMDFFGLPNPIGARLEFPKLTPLRHYKIETHRSIFSAIDDSDQLLHFPYHSYNYILQFFNQAAIDPHVKQVKVAFYRMAKNSIIGESLISAAKNGKEVTVFMELKARFDEANNLMWAEKMQDAGVKVIYSIPGLKVHAKVALVRKKMEDGSIRNYSFLGTGNLNEDTARIYSDQGLLTCHKKIGEELNDLFNYLYRRKPPKPFKHLFVSQFNIIDNLKRLIDREISHVKKGKKGKIVIKLNNLQERVMIEKLYEASQAGVQIEMIVRSVCCLVPGVPGISENITVRRIVDRFLEHSRMFLFHNNGAEEVFMGSADWMKRNLRSRIEVIFPVYNKDLKRQIKDLLEVQFADNVKAVMIGQNNDNIPIPISEEEPRVQAQLASYDLVKAWEGVK